MNSDIVSAANDKEQAGMVYKYVKQIILLSPYLQDKLTPVDSKKRIVYHACGNAYAALSAEAATKHGMSPIVVIYDELAQSKNMDLYDSLETAQGAWDEPLFIVISTQSNDPQHPLSIMIDDGLTGADPAIVCHLYEVLEDHDDIFDPEVWHDANPALGDFRNFEDLRRLAEKAKRLPSRENVFRNLYLNQRVSQDVTLFSRSVWMACKGKVEIAEGAKVYLALDLAATTDLAALTMFEPESGALEAFFWKPEDLFEEHGKRDRRSYYDWKEEGWFEPCPGKTIDRDLIAAKVVDLMERYEVVGLAYDRWRIDEFIKAMERKDIVASEDWSADLTVFPWGQGYKDMSPAIDAFETEVIEGRVRHGNNPALTWNVANAIVVQDPAGNRKLDKAKSRMRIDGAVASAMAVGLWSRLREEDPYSVYATEEVLII